MNSRKRVAGSDDGTEWRASNHCNILQFPRSIAMNVLSRLPIKTLFTCRCVCKTWFHIISDPLFAKIHLANSPISILIKTMPSKCESRQLLSARLELSKAGYRFSGEKLKFTPKSNLPNFKISLVSSCNGLLCLFGFEDDDPIYVCNPILGEYVTISSAYKGRKCGTLFGFGFCCGTDQYKVLQTFHPMIDIESHSRIEYQEAKIYTIGRGGWRSIGNVPFVLVNSPFNAFLKGVLHWAPGGPNTRELICCFDFESEKFGVVPPPSDFGSMDKECSDFVKLGVLGGFLYFCYFARSDQFDIWIMKDYGVKESWTKQFVIQGLIFPRQRRWDFYEPITILKSGEILMLYNDDGVACYNPKTKRTREYRIFRNRSQFHGIAYTPSFVSLFNVAQGEYLRSMSRSGSRGQA